MLIDIFRVCRCLFFVVFCWFNYGDIGGFFRVFGCWKRLVLEILWENVCSRLNSVF